MTKETMTTVDEKKPVTTVESILSGKELTIFRSAQKTWNTGTKNSIKALKSMAQVGTALNLLYERGIEKGLKREAITDMVRNAFQGLDRRERSDYRALALNFIEVKCFVEFSEIKSLNPTYLLNAWRKAMTEDRASCTFVEHEMAGGVDAQGKVMEDKEDKEGETPVTVSETPVTVSETPVKTGLSVKSEPLSAKEVVEQTGFILNKVKTLFNEGKFDANDLATIEKHLTSTIQHINSVDEGILQAAL